MSLSVTWHLVSVFDMSVGGEVSLLTSAHHHLCPFVDPGLVRVCFGAFAIIWAVVFITGQLSSFVGSDGLLVP